MRNQLLQSFRPNNCLVEVKTGRYVLHRSERRKFKKIKDMTLQVEENFVALAQEIMSVDVRNPDESTT